MSPAIAGCLLKSMNYKQEISDATANVPKSLFKYLSPNRANDLQRDEVGFSPPNRFNDAFDVRPKVLPITDPDFLNVGAKNAWKQFLNSVPEREKAAFRRRTGEMQHGAVEYFQSIASDFAAEQQATLQDEISKHFTIFCLSESNDEDKMWGLYAESHKGFVIEYDSSHPAFMALGQPEKVAYREEDPVYDPVRGAQGFWKVKKQKWSYEREWRISRRLNSCRRLLVKGTTVYLVPLPRAAIRAVYLGIRIAAATESNINAALMGMQIPVLRATIPRGSSKIAFEPRK